MGHGIDLSGLSDEDRERAEQLIAQAQAKGNEYSDRDTHYPPGTTPN